MLVTREKLGCSNPYAVFPLLTHRTTRTPRDLGGILGLQVRPPGSPSLGSSLELRLIMTLTVGHLLGACIVFRAHREVGEKPVGRPYLLTAHSLSHPCCSVRKWLPLSSGKCPGGSHTAVLSLLVPWHWVCRCTPFSMVLSMVC